MRFKSVLDIKFLVKEKFLPCLFCYVLLINVCVGTPIERQDSELLPYHLRLDRNGSLTLRWDVMYDEENLLIELVTDFKDSHVHHWIGFGFSDYGEAANADLVIYWTDVEGRHHFQDAWTDSDGILHIDEEQNYELLDVEKKANNVALVFSRSFDTCDRRDYRIDDGTTHIIFFTGHGEFLTSEGLNVKSLDVGLQRAQLLKPVLSQPRLPDDAKTFKITNDKLHVPASETTYWCRTQKIPLLTSKHHVVKFEPFIQEGNEALVHHMEVFHCEVPEGQIVPFYNGPCSSEMRPTKLVSCSKVIGAWAMGAEALLYPEEAGYPIGGPGYSPYVMIEVHFNNPEKRSDWVDSSGLMFTYTSQLRQHDAGCMELGLEYSPKMAIPPEQEKFYVNGYCTPECTTTGIPEDGINIFASQLHSHLTGRKIRTKHVRGGVQLPDLNKDDHYSPHFQEIRRLPRPVRILPGDALITTCDYKTTGRRNVTMGGWAISEEMCVNYVHYYPRVDLEVCKSSIDTATLTGYFEFMRDFDDADTSRSNSYKDNYSAINWSKSGNVAWLQRMYNIAPLSMQCNRSNGERFPGYWNGIQPPAITTPLPAQPDTCSPVWSN